MYFPEFFYSFFHFPKLSYILCLFFNNMLQIWEEEHSSVVLLSATFLTSVFFKFLSIVNIVPVVHMGRVGVLRICNKMP